MKGFGTDEQTIIDILCSRTNKQRQEIAKFFTEEYGRDIIEDLKSELGGNFEDVIVALMRPWDEYLCKQLNKAMDGAGTDEEALVEILCTRENDEIQQLVETYERSKIPVPLELGPPRECVGPREKYMRKTYCDLNQIANLIRFLYSSVRQTPRRTHVFRNNWRF